MKKSENDYFLKTKRIGFSKWTQSNIELAKTLWGNPEVTRYICASGKFSESDIKNRLALEIENDNKYQVQYWPIFTLAENQFIGCCGLRPHNNKGKKGYEIGFHLRPEFWGQGYGKEAAEAVINYAFTVLKTGKLFAGHNPNNTASKKLLSSLGFIYVKDEYYEPTGLYHPSYELAR